MTGRSRKLSSRRGSSRLFGEECFGVRLGAQRIGLPGELALVGGVTKTRQGLPQVNRLGDFWLGFDAGTQCGDGGGRDVFLGIADQ